MLQNDDADDDKHDFIDDDDCGGKVFTSYFTSLLNIIMLNCAEYKQTNKQTNDKYHLIINAENRKKKSVIKKSC